MQGAISEAFQQFEVAPTGRMLDMLELPQGAMALLRGVEWHSYKEDAVSILVRLHFSRDACVVSQQLKHGIRIFFIEK